ncbi:MAG: hypothetical protein IJD80_04570, partial [Oscillospiraceae bacterium]|nr:hypothetical protein [Oscillospiraceae bacterium]
SYMVIYHRQSSDLWNFTATFILLFVLSSLPNIRINKLALPVSLLVFILVARAIVLNIKKVNPINLYSTRILGKAGDYNITLFDYIIPLNIICRDNLSCSRKNVISFIILQFFTEIMLSIYAFSCLKGNLLYSISPLQMLFRISNGVLIDNFDAIFNLLLYFAYFSAIIVLMYAYNRIKQRFLYIGKYDLLLVPVFMIVIPIITADVWFVLQVLIAAIIFTGGKKVRVGCND